MENIRDAIQEYLAAAAKLTPEATSREQAGLSYAGRYNSSHPCASSNSQKSQRVLDDVALIRRMREALIAYSKGECEMPMPMHLAIDPEQAEVHIKSSYRRGGKYYALKIASTFPGNLARGLSTGNGMMLLCSAETGEPIAVLADGGISPMSAPRPWPR